MIIFLLIVLVGFAVQYIDGALGMGYGASSSSLLIAAGLMPALVSASVHTAEIFATLASGISHLRFGNINKKIVLPLICTGVIGGVFGAYFLANMPGKLMRPIIAIILLVMGARIFVKYILKKHIILGKGELAKSFLLPLGFLGGAIDAIGGGGWGPLCTSTLVSANKSEPRYVIGSVNLAEFFVTIAITLTFGLVIGFENFLWAITIPLIIGGVIAAPIAAYTCKRVSPRILGILVGAILIALNARTLIMTI
ncbi:MAG: sulfite exporter TauE/SafE family protein [Candidatus Thermoplasmatota archaeon]|nr:sulfite exporter TauE/SafE family protein [Candidatus Thermoplasmatota archaeon]